jgi:predicted dehydrogenase
MSDKVIRWGILGTGKIAHTFAQALAALPDAQLVAVASRSSATANQFGAEFNIAHCHGSYQALADDPQVDVIYIATPHVLHADNAIMCLQSGKHVLCEKAFTMNRREAQEVIDLARSKKLFLMEAMWTRFLPAIQEAKRIIASGEIGSVRHIQSDLGFVAKVGPEHRVLNPDLGGGALLDIGIYPLSISACFLGPVDVVQAIGELGATGIDLQTAFSLQHQGGGISSCACSLTAATPNQMAISGDLGHILLHPRFHQVKTLTVTLTDGSSRTVQCPPLGNGYAHQAIEVMRCIRAGLLESPVMPLDETLALMGVLDTIRAQIKLSYRADGAAL